MNFLKQYIKKADIVLFLFLVVCGLAATAAIALSHSGGDTVVIESAGKLYATYPLFEDRTVEVPAPGSSKADSDDAAHTYTEYNLVEISGGQVTVTEASCKNQVCVKHSSISRSGESIVCLPNRLVVRIEGGKNGGDKGYDSVTS